ncbi:unnamed protein product [Arctia plantaginis]|uniref:Uncharacterized protein n=1 Tax=Arctia plantaginis TaxID=874455 RepID=A0A8S1B7L4_ARCPL|nr:unnamed protein product [Arctia plantaginis]
MTDSQENKTCPPRKSPVYQADKEELAKFAANADILPLYEKSTMEYIFRNHYSLKNNEYLQCAWTKFKDNISSRVVAPIELPGQG